MFANATAFTPLSIFVNYLGVFLIHISASSLDLAQSIFPSLPQTELSKTQTTPHHSPVKNLASAPYCL